MKYWNVDKEELFELAIENTQRLFKVNVESLTDKLVDMIVADLDEESANEFYDMMASVGDFIPMYVCSNESKINGAGTFIYSGLLKEFAEQMKSDIYILPSSIHEVIFIPSKYGKSVGELKGIVRNVNGTELLPEEILSDSVYRYNRKLDRVEKM